MAWAPQPPASGQYWANTALFPAPDCPATVTFQPLASKEPCLTEKFVIVAVVVCARALSVIVGRVGSAGGVPKVGAARAGGGAPSTSRARGIAPNPRRRCMLTPAGTPSEDRRAAWPR